MATARIKTYEQACKKLGINPKALPGVSKLPVKDRKAIIAHYKLVKIAQALNGEWKPNWNDNSEGKYYPWFEVKADAKRPSGFGFSGADCGSWRTCTAVGSRLCFKSSELAVYAGKQFAKLYQEYFLMS
jgi:hypothetical protein